MKTFSSIMLQIILASGILYGYYHFFLRNKKFHQYNRYYLLLATVISICIPFLSIPVYFDAEETRPILIKTLTAFSSENFEEDVIISNLSSPQTWFTWKNIFSSLYLLIAVFLFVRFIVALIRIARLINIYPGEKIDTIRFITTNDPATPFSFFRWLFWNNKIEINSDNGQQIFRHELFHIRQKHSWDIIFLEIISITVWLNPFFHLIKKEIKTIHEFLADKFAVEENKEWDYAELLLMQVLGSHNTRLTNPFFHNQIKRRIAMLTTSQKSGYQYLRKIMVLPLAAIIVGLFAFTYKNKAANKTIWSEKPITIVVDAGHGGDDPGAMSIDKKHSEAVISLEIARQMQELAGEYNITVVLTRNDEQYPGGETDRREANRKRIEIANTIKPAAFISLHISTTPAKEYQNNYSGFEAFISRKRDDINNKLLASAILQNLSPLYKTRTEARIRNSQGIFVLDQNNYPSMLLECGFINNETDLAFITDKANQEKIARSILEGIVNYKNANTSAHGDQSQLMSDTVPSKKEIIVTDGSVIVKDNDQKTLLKADSIVYRLDKGKTMNPPLYVIDGVVTKDENALSKIAPNTIESIAVLKGKSATDKYKEDGANGVIEIKTKKEIESPARKDAILKEVVVVGYRTNQIDNKPVFEKVEVEPSFPGGEAAWRKYLERNINPNIPVDNGAPAGAYKVMVQYIVKDDGSIHDIKALTTHGYGMEAEAIRLLQSSPDWVPAMQNGKQVNAYRKQPITFIVNEEKVNQETGKDKIPVITLADLINSTPHALLKLQDDISIISYTFTIDDEVGNIHESANNGAQFTSATNRLIQNATKGRILTVDKIRGIKNGKEIKFPAVVYKVI